MRIYKTVQQTTNVQVIESATCDRCHKVIEVNQQYGYVRGGQIIIDAGYGSGFDDCDLKPDCCDDCFGWLLGEFVHKE